MTALAVFVNQLLDDGEIIFAGPPHTPPGDRPQARDLLERAYETYCLETAGPALPFQDDIAVAAAEFLWQACWFLVHRGEPDAEVERRLEMPKPDSAADHLSADLMLRYAATVFRRARSLAVDDPLTLRLTQVLREWPLSGVLADIADGPLIEPEFDGHSGLRLLYAERLAEHWKPAWLPQGPGSEYVKWVFQESGRQVPVLPGGLARDSE